MGEFYRLYCKTAFYKTASLIETQELNVEIVLDLVQRSSGVMD